LVVRSQKPEEMPITLGPRLLASDNRQLTLLASCF
jgi:hypothetical protein